VRSVCFWKLFTLHIQNDILNRIKAFEKSSALYSTKPIPPDPMKIHLSPIMTLYHTGGHFQYELSFY